MELYAAMPVPDRTAEVPHALTVSELTRLVKDTLQGNPLLTRILVCGETSNVQRLPSGLVFFTMKDASAQVSCVMFREEASALPFDLEDGLDVVASGDIDLFTRKGEIQFVVRALTPSGVGAFWVTFQRTRKKLEREHLFDEARKRPLPEFPRRIGVVTSESGAVLHDIVTILGRRFPLADVVVSPAIVQGPEAPASVRRALVEVARFVDVVILARGGGSLEDLWAFNDEALARAIAACPVPVISAVGHETDVTIADFVADVRAPTPSAAAELVSPDRGDLDARLVTIRRDLERGLRDAVREGATRLAALADRLSLKRLRMDIEVEGSRLGDIQHSLGVGIRRALRREGERLEALARRLDVLSPLATLRRGYAIVSREDGSLVARATDTIPQDEITVQLQDGRLHAHIDRTEVA
ncbi:MAG: exodeoxyribonuclease VII large subunit [Thermoplasmata archaeon]|nr:exodeoxyribonuclease VII large subunit [Thermoplasmata archaeon]